MKAWLCYEVSLTYNKGSTRVNGHITLSIAVPSPNLKSVVSLAISSAEDIQKHGCRKNILKQKTSI